MSRALTFTAMLVLVAVFFSPIWWVSLKAPNYPPEAFPDGVRIHFHFNGVFNGCTLLERDEIHEDEALNCVHEMNTINHYVGMYPIESAAVIERAFSSQLIAFLIVMLAAFMMPGKKSQLAVLSVGFATVAVWLGMMLFSKGGILLTSKGYIDALLLSLDMDLHEIEDWTGYHAIVAAYKDSLGSYFRNKAEIAPRVAFISQAIYVIAAGLVASMLFLIGGLLVKHKWFYWLLILIPMLLPIFFIIDYAAWLWWYGHTLNDMAAFSIKPFMPTVFGDGKVAQFSTHSYPHYGFGLIVLSSLLLALAALLRRKQLRRETAA
jgi:hypothetical protein